MEIFTSFFAACLKSFLHSYHVMHHHSSQTQLRASQYNTTWLWPEQHVNVQNNMLTSKTMRHAKHNMLEIWNTSQYLLLGTTKLAPNTTLHYKPYKNYLPVLLCTTKLAQSTSQYYFVLQSLHKVVPSILQFAASKPDLDAKATKPQSWSTFYKEF